MWTQGVPVEEDAYRQIRNIAGLPILGGPVAIMPDVHVGKGATVGAVIPTKAAVIPSAVGVDIGCGMVAQRTTLEASDLPDSLSRIRAQITLSGVTPPKACPNQTIRAETGVEAAIRVVARQAKVVSRRQ